MKQLDFPKNQRSKTKWRDRPLGRLQNSRVFFSPNRVFKAQKRRHSVRVLHEPHTPYWRLFSASLQTFSLFDCSCVFSYTKIRTGVRCSLPSGSAYHIILKIKSFLPQHSKNLRVTLSNPIPLCITLGRQLNLPLILITYWESLRAAHAWMCAETRKTSLSHGRKCSKNTFHHWAQWWNVFLLHLAARLDRSFALPVVLSKWKRMQTRAMIVSTSNTLQ